MRAVGVVVGAVLVCVAMLMPAGGAGAQGGPDPAKVGSFSQPFTEPTISDFAGYPRVRTDQQCIERPKQGSGATGAGTTHGFIDCKPAAGGLTMLPNGKNMYWDNLAGTENVELSIVSEYGVVGLNDQTRLLNTATKSWAEPTPVDGGAKSQAHIDPIIPGDLFKTTEDKNDGSMFCSDGNFLPDGRFMATGGTKYINDPGNDASKYGSTELLGIENTRIYDPKTNRWTQTGSMNRPRWYPTATTLGNGDEFVVSGLRRLVKAANTQDPIDPTAPATGGGVQEGQNERETETFDSDKGTWKLNGASARRSLPLFARMHLLPNGHVFYNAGGQAFNPLGQAYDEALWNLAAAYDPATKKWNELGIPGVGTSPVPGFRGSTFSVMMPLVPNSKGQYEHASFLTGGGVTNPGSPGGYVAIRDSFLTNLNTSNGTERMSTEDAGDMNPTSTPATGRWYGSGTLLPTGEVLATSGADRDEVAVPGTEIPVQTAEIYNPDTKQWKPVAHQNRPRTYHNTANLMPDARVLVGGHATISNSYLRNTTLPGGVTAPQGRDPSFEIYSPPYLSCPGAQANITSITGSNGSLQIQMDVPASQIKNVVLVRNPSVTHVVDADQRNVELRVISRSGNTIQVQQAGSGNVVPPGPYMLFVNRDVNGCIKPSHAAQVLAAAHGKIKPTTGCLARRSPIGRNHIGRVRLGRTRRRLLAEPRLARVSPLKKTAHIYRYCVKGTSKRVTAVFGSKTKVDLVTTTAPRHGNRGVRPGSSARRMARAFPRRKRIAKGLYRANPRSPRLIGVRRGRVRYFAVASKRTLKSKRLLRVYLRRAGL